MAIAGRQAGLKMASLGSRQVPAMAIGTWAWGDKGQWGWDEAKDLPLVQAVWKACNEEGLTFYDTAEVYGMGESEKIIGNLLKDTDAEMRSKIYIASKIIPMPIPGLHFYVFNPPVVASLKASLKRLQLDSIDLYQIHRYPLVGSVKAWAAGLAECVKLGLTKSIGVSNFSLEEMLAFEKELATHNVPLASNQVEFSLLRQHADKNGMLAEMKKRNIALLAYSPLGMGRLTGKYSKENPPPSNRKFSKHITMEQMEPLLQEMRELGKKYDVPVSAIAINWVISKGAIPLGGARNGDQAAQNAKAISFTLTAEEVERLSSKGFDGKTDSFWQHG